MVCVCDLLERELLLPIRSVSQRLPFDVRHDNGEPPRSCSGGPSLRSESAARTSPESSSARMWGWSRRAVRRISRWNRSGPNAAATSASKTLSARRVGRAGGALVRCASRRAPDRRGHPLHASRRTQRANTRTRLSARAGGAGGGFSRTAGRHGAQRAAAHSSTSRAKVAATRSRGRTTRTPR